MIAGQLLSQLRQLYQPGGALPPELNRFWLVWEAGEGEAASPMEQTLQPGPARPAAEGHTEPVCFGLAPGSGPQVVRIGRATHNDVVLDDRTVSREHLVIIRDVYGRWLAESLTGGYTELGDPLPAGSSRPMASGDRLRLGWAVLRFYDGPGMAARLKR